MLQHLGNVFFTVSEIDRKDNHNVPTIYLNIYNRTTRQIIGLLRFNHDHKYSKNAQEIRMAFDVFDPKELDPCTSNLLEDIIVGGFVWITMDNHYTYSFYPRPYMVIHNYKEDSDLMQMINAKSISILQELGCEKGTNDDNMYVFSKDITSRYLSDILSRRH